MNGISLEVYVGQAEPFDKLENFIKISSLNCQGLAGKDKRNDVIQNLKNIKSDIIYKILT